MNKAYLDMQEAYDLLVPYSEDGAIAIVSRILDKKIRLSLAGFCWRCDGAGKETIWEGLTVKEIIVCKECDGTGKDGTDGN